MNSTIRDHLQRLREEANALETGRSTTKPGDVAKARVLVGLDAINAKLGTEVLLSPEWRKPTSGTGRSFGRLCESARRRRCGQAAL